MTIQVVIADDQPLIRAGIGALFHGAPDMRVVAQAGIGTVVAMVAEHRPDVVVLDLPDDHIDVIGEILARGAGRVIFLPSRCTVRLLRDALLAGAAGCLLKPSAPAALVDVVRVVSVTGIWIDPVLVGAVLRELSGLPANGNSPGMPEPLTRREQEILLLMAEGLSNDEIARRLYISAFTVRTHVGRVLMKLGVRNRAHAVTAAYRMGLVRVSPAA